MRPIQLGLSQDKQQSDRADDDREDRIGTQCFPAASNHSGHLDPIPGELSPHQCFGLDVLDGVVPGNFQFMQWGGCPVILGTDHRPVKGG